MLARYLLAFLPLFALASASPMDPVRRHKGTSTTSAAVATVTAATAATTTTAAAATTTTAAAATTTTTAAANVAAASGGACPTFALQDYADFQISDGTAGNAQAEANAVFVDPYDGCDLSTVDATSLQNLQTMREAAESAETDLFDPQIDAATGDAATALQNGKIKNKVLKLTGEIQGLNIQAAQGSDETSEIAAEQTKLDSNVSLDTAASGQTAQAASAA